MLLQLLSNQCTWASLLWSPGTRRNQFHADLSSAHRARWATRLKAQEVKESKKAHLKQPGPWREFQSSRSFTSFHSWRSGLPQIGVEPATTYLPSVSQRFNSLLMGSTFQTNPIDREHTVTYKDKAGRTSSMKCIWHTETFKSQLIRTATEVTSPSLHTLSQEENFATKPYGWTQWS